ncbi:MAG TPA: LuxR C-terminal-related transcriptional regulator [Acidimicrobiia bacterium]|nr:LuxR C-terminal-related transcriptional regulator [Acidimicrobiia bacterium]
MGDTHHAGVHEADALDVLLLDAKISVPELRDGMVSRADLVDRARGSQCSIIGLTAPAGYGKSTLLTEWAHTEDRPVAWVSLDRFDDDPNILLTLLASAYCKIFPERGDLVAEVRGIGFSPLGRAAPRLATAFRSSTSPFVLVIDDFHELRQSACHDALSIVIAGISAGSQLLTASRTEQPHLARLRASGAALELEANDLALDAIAASAIFAYATVSLPPERAAQVIDRTEGWPVGLYLAALIAKESGDDARSISGEDRYVADYLYHEALATLPERDQQFLRRSSVLDQLCGPLCDAVLRDADAQQHLWDLASSNLFLVPLDRRREWFRYHGLFREFLLGELHRREPELVAKLHLRAADWYEANGVPGLALEHLLNTAERDRCVQVLTALVLPTYQAGNMSTAQRWLTALGDPVVEGYPPLAALAGWIAALTGDVAGTQRWTHFIDSASFSLVPGDGSASFDSARAMLRAAVCADGVEQMVTDATLAADQEPRWSPWRDTALCVLGQAMLLSGDIDRATTLFAETTTVGAELGNADNMVISEADLAVLAMDAGDWDDAGAHVSVALTALDEAHMRDYPISLLAFAAAARLAWRNGDHEESARHLSHAMRIRMSCTITLPWLSVRSRLQLAKVHWTMGETNTARQLLVEIVEIMEDRPDLGVLADEVSDFRAIFTSSAGATGGSPLSPAELRVLPYLQTHLTFPEIGERLFVSRNTIKSEVTSIYRKLGASSRSEAVQQATAIGLLGG